MLHCLWQTSQFTQHSNVVFLRWLQTSHCTLTLVKSYRCVFITITKIWFPSVMIRTLRALIVCCSVGVTARTLWQGSRDVLPQTVELLGCVLLYQVMLVITVEWHSCLIYCSAEESDKCSDHLLITADYFSANASILMTPLLRRICRAINNDADRTASRV